MENENVIGKVCFAILRKGFVAGLRISLELDSPGCIIGCKFDGAGIVGNTVIDDTVTQILRRSLSLIEQQYVLEGDRTVGRRHLTDTAAAHFIVLLAGHIHITAQQVVGHVVFHRQLK